MKKNEKSSIWPKLSAFRTNYHVLAFSRTFQQKVEKSASFREKTRKIVDLAKTLNFSNNLPHFGVLTNFSAKSCTKCLISRKKNEKSSTRPKLSTFRTNYHLSAFWQAFQLKLAKSPSFREKTRKIVDLAKTLTFSNKLPGFGVLTNFPAKSCKKCLISWKNTKNRRLGQNSQLIQKTTRFRRFDKLFSKKLQKVPHFVKKHEKPSTSPRLSTFRTNYHVSAFWRASQQKLAKSAPFRANHEKSST